MKKFIISASILLILPALSYAEEAESPEANASETTINEDRLEAQRNRRLEYLKKIRDRYLKKLSERNTVANPEVREYENERESWEKRRYIRSDEVRGTTRRRYGTDYYSYSKQKWSNLAKERTTEEDSEKEYVYRNYKDENALKRRVRKLTDKIKWQEEMKSHFRSRYGRYRPSIYRTKN